MKTKYLVFGLILMLCGFVSSQFVYSEDKVVESYSATLVNMQGAGAGPISMKILIYGYTSDEDVAKLAATLKSGGQDALVKALDKVEKGRIAPVSRLGNDVNYVRVIQTEKGKIIRMVTNRQMSFMELNRNARSTDYPFGILELVVGNDGKIEGTVIAGAKMQINKENVLEVESYSTQPLRLMSIRKTD